jgi:hypothetical protein
MSISYAWLVRILVVADEPRMAALLKRGTKPFSFDELTTRLGMLIRRGAVEGISELRVADLRPDAASRRAWRGEVEIELSTREFDLLRRATHPMQKDIFQPCPIRHRF